MIEKGKRLNFKKEYLLLILLLFNPVFNSKLLGQKINENNNLTDIKFSSDNNNLYTDDYIVGPGDKLLINFSGLKIYSQLYSINSEGYLFLPEIDLYYANGKTLSEIKKELNSKYQEFIINPKIDLFISSYRPVSVVLIGAMNRPGLYSLNYKFGNTSEGPKYGNTEQTTFLAPKLFDILKKGKGFKYNADISNIQIIRKNPISKGGGKIQTTINVLDLLKNGEQNLNISIKDGDSIIVPISNKNVKEQILSINRGNISPDKITVYVSGNIRSPGQITLKQGSSLRQAIAAVGGRKIMSGKIEFLRFDGFGKANKRIIRYDADANIDSLRNPLLIEGDIINIKKSIFGAGTEIITEVTTPLIQPFAIFSLFED